jgi:hypothetical protein
MGVVSKTEITGDFFDRSASADLKLQMSSLPASRLSFRPHIWRFNSALGVVV